MVKSYYNKYLIFSILPAVLVTVSYNSFIKIQENNTAFSNSMFSFLLFSFAITVISKSYKILNKRLCFISTVLGIIFSAFLMFGKNMIIYNTTSFFEVKTWINVLLFSPLFISIISVLIHYVPKLNVRFSVKDSSEFVLKIEALFDKKRFFFVIWGIIFIFWLPGLIASYPGIFGYDSVYQIEYYLSGCFSLHHPIAHTYLLGFFVKTLGHDVFNSYSVGMFLYSVFQTLCMSAAFAGIYKYIRKRANIIFRMVFLVFFIFLPMNIIMSVSCTKDVLFSGLFSIMIILVMMAVENNELLKRPGYLISFISTAFFMSIFRSQGIYIFIFGMIFLLISLRKYYKQLLTVFVSVFIVFSLYSGPVTKLAGGVKSDSLKEMMSVPCMQLSKALLDNEKQLTREQVQQINEYMPNYKSYKTFPAISDSIKNTFNTEKFKNDPVAFVKLWLSVGVKSPKAYIDAFARLTIGLWYPDMNYNDKDAYHPYWEYYPTGQNDEDWTKQYITIKQTKPHAFSCLYELYEKLTYDKQYQSIPLISTVFNGGICIWIMLFGLFTAIYYKKYKLSAGLMFLLGLWFTLLLGPVVLYRYVYPIIVSTPIVITSILNIKE